MSRGSLSARAAAALGAAVLAQACGLDVAGTASRAAPDGGALHGPDAGAPPAQTCADGTVCDVVKSTTVVDVAVTATALFWLESSGAVMTAHPDGTSARSLVTGESPPLAGLEADADSVYWTANGKLRRASASDGSGARDVASAQGGCLRWTTPGKLLVAEPAQSRIVEVDVSTGQTSTVTSNSSEPWGVAGPGNFFYTNYDRGLIRQRGNGGVNPTLVTGQGGPRCMATEGTSLWWANRTSGDLVQSTTSGQGVQAVARGQTAVSGVALDAAHVYWSWSGGIRRQKR